MVAILFVGLFAGTGSALAYRALQNGVDRHDVTELLGTDRPAKSTKPDNPNDPLEGQAYNILVMGTDSREGDENLTLGGGKNVTGMRSDTTMLVHVAADRSRVDVVSIPRDLVVDIPSCPLSDGTETEPRIAGQGWDDQQRMWNVPFSIGGALGDIEFAATCTVRTFENMTDIYIDDFAVVDMAGFKDMVNAIGGVDMCFKEDLYSEKAHLNIKAGCHKLNGKTALALARARTGEGLGDGSDISRIDRQQELLTNMVEQVLDRNVLTNTTELFQFLKAATASLTTSERIGNLTTMAGLAYSARELSADDVNFATVPWAPAGNRVIPTSDSEELWASLRDDKPMVLPLDPNAEESQG